MEDLFVDGQEYRDQIHHSNLGEQLYLFRETEKFCDTLVIVQDKTFKAHRCVLAAASPYFNSILKSNTKNLLGQQRQSVPCDEPHLFGSVLRFIYTGNIVINHSNVKGFSLLAQTLGLRNLVEFCCDYLERNLSPYNCLTSLLISKQCNLANSEDVIYRKINDNIDIVIDTQEIKQLPFNMLENLLKSKELNITNEQIFSLICNWIKHKLDKRKFFLPTLLTFINWKVVDVNKVLGVLRDHTELQSLDLCVSILEALKESALPQDFLSGIIEDLKSNSNRTQPAVKEEGFMQLAVKTAIGPESDNATPPRHYGNSYEPAESNYQIYIPKNPLDAKSHFYDRNGYRQTENYYSEVINHAESIPHSSHVIDEVLHGANDCNENSLPPEPMDQSIMRDPLVNLKKNTESETGKRHSMVSDGPVTEYNSSNSNMNEEELAPINLSDGLNSWRNPSDGCATGPFPYTDEDINRALCFFKAPDETQQSSSYTESRGVPNSVENYDLFTQSFLKSSDEKLFSEESLLDPDQEECRNQTTGEESRSGIEVVQEVSKPSASENSLEQSLPRSQRRSYRLSNKETQKMTQETSELSQRINTSPRQDTTRTEVTKEDSDPNSQTKCDLCGFDITDRKKLYGHMRIHFPGPSFSCDICKNKVKNLYHLVSHRLTHFQEKKFKCPECDFRTHRKFNLEEHLLVHRDERQFKCEICGSSFTRQSFLETHYSKHRDVKPFVCDHCGWKGKTKATLRIHMKKHTGNLYQCTHEGCRFESSKRSSMQDHLRSHSNVRSFSCDQCGSMFSVRSHLNRHLRTHDPSQQIHCQLCDYSTFRKESYARHMRVTHPNGTSTDNTIELVAQKSPNGSCGGSSNGNAEDPDDALMIVADLDEQPDSHA